MFKQPFTVLRLEINLINPKHRKSGIRTLI